MNSTQILELFGKVTRYTRSHADCARRGGAIVVTMAERKKIALEDGNTTQSPNRSSNLTSTDGENTDDYVTVRITNQENGYMCMRCCMCDKSEYLKC
jgi:hypothetical protein